MIYLVILILNMKYFYSVFVLFYCIAGSSQLTIDKTTYSLQQLVENVLINNPDVVVSNVTLAGNADQIAYFNGASTNLGINSGVVLSSGDVIDAVGPNNQAGKGTDLQTNIADIDLEILSSNFSFDAVTLEFDFVPNGNFINFNFVFASEEYLEFINSSVNDAFGFFISGPNITGSYSLNSENIALIPNTNTPITIDNVNNLSNSQYYINNGDGFSGAQFSDSAIIQADGLTTKLTASRFVECGETYHLKIALADMGDGILDSWVYLEEGSFDVEIIKQEMPFSLPNVLTPNNDNVNDVFKPLNASVLPSEIQFNVFNRWGNLVYTTSKTSIDWDGTNKSGKPLNDGIYYYETKLTYLFCGSEKNEQSLNGNVTIFNK